MLLWWPVLFQEVDTVSAWFVRGVVWTVGFRPIKVVRVTKVVKVVQHAPVVSREP